ncbi:MAG: HD-GYP domain-containing protein [Longimicrobiales bacterium]
MTEAVRFLTSLSQSLATMTLYEDGHPARERVIDTAYGALRDLQSVIERPLFTFLGDDVVCGKVPIRDLKAWDWAERLSSAGVQRLEFEEDVTREEFEAFLEDVLARITDSAGSTADARQLSRSGIRFGEVGVRGETNEVDTPTAVTNYTLGVEAEAVRWLHDQVKGRSGLQLGEAVAVVRSLSLAMHADQQMMIPLLRLRRYDEYTTTHSLNVAVLAMAFAEFVGVSSRDVRTFGLAGLLHDIGKVNIPPEILTKPGKLTDEERSVINHHPSDGARIIIETEKNMELAAVVAYEHHIMLDGGGYPRLRFPRDCHFASKLVHVCDVYDALRTKRPYRDAWSAARVLEYIGERSGSEFDRDLAASFVRMMRLWEERVSYVEEDQPVLSARDRLPGESAATNAV